MPTESERAVLRDGFSGGPHGVGTLRDFFASFQFLKVPRIFTGDPNDTRLRNVEKEILIPQKMRDKARDEKCTDLVAEFGVCCKKQGLLLPFLCRKENNALKACLKKWYDDPDFRQLCTQEYLADRKRFRETGVRSNQKRKDKVI
uniref:COX assembly mitochondrial protein n=1 Tax=Ixodes ricinus TaxID=34613 RepID=A0A6B0UU93_IXORI